MTTCTPLEASGAGCTVVSVPPLGAGIVRLVPATSALDAIVEPRAPTVARPCRRRPPRSCRRRPSCRRQPCRPTTLSPSRRRSSGTTDSGEAGRFLAAGFALQEALDLGGELVAGGHAPSSPRHRSPAAPGTSRASSSAPTAASSRVRWRARRRPARPAAARRRGGDRAGPADAMAPGANGPPDVVRHLRVEPHGGDARAPASPSRPPTVRPPGTRSSPAGPCSTSSCSRPSAEAVPNTRHRARVRHRGGDRTQADPLHDAEPQRDLGRRRRQLAPAEVGLGAVQHQHVASVHRCAARRRSRAIADGQRAVDDVEHGPARAVVEQRVGVDRGDGLGAVRQSLRRGRCRAARIDPAVERAHQHGSHAAPGRRRGVGTGVTADSLASSRRECRSGRP